MNSLLIKLTKISNVNKYVSSFSFVLLILYLFGESFISVLSFFHVIFGSALPLQRHSILIDFCFVSFVVRGLSKAGANLSTCSKLALSPVTLIATLATDVPTSFDIVHLYTPLSDDAKF